MKTEEEHLLLPTVLAESLINVLCTCLENVDRRHVQRPKLQRNGNMDVFMLLDIRMSARNRLWGIIPHGSPAD